MKHTVFSNALILSSAMLRVESGLRQACLMLLQNPASFLSKVFVTRRWPCDSFFECLQLVNALFKWWYLHICPFKTQIVQRLDHLWLMIVPVEWGLRRACLVLLENAASFLFKQVSVMRRWPCASLNAFNCSRRCSNDLANDDVHTFLHSNPRSPIRVSSSFIFQRRGEIDCSKSYYFTVRDK